MKTPEEYLEHYHKRYNLKYRVFTANPARFFHWINYKSKGYTEYCKEYGQPNNRELMPDEIVLDIDGNHYPYDFDCREEKENEELTQELVSLLSVNNYGFEVWHSGNKGYHFHMFFPELMQYPLFERRTLKEMIVKKMCYGYLTKKEGRSHVDLPNTIQLELADHRKGKGYKRRFMRTLAGCCTNNIPEEVLKQFKEHKRKQALQKLLLKPPRIEDGKTPKEILFIENEDFAGLRDGRSRAMFVLASYYKSKGLKPGAVLDKLREWNSYTIHSYFSDAKLRGQVEYRFKSKNNFVPLSYARKLLGELGVKLK